MGLTTNLYRGCHPVTKYHEHPSMLVNLVEGFFYGFEGPIGFITLKNNHVREKLLFFQASNKQIQEKILCLKSYIHPRRGGAGREGRRKPSAAREIRLDLLRVASITSGPASMRSKSQAPLLRRARQGSLTTFATWKLPMKPAQCKR